MPPPHLAARVIHGWLIIINNHPSLARLARNFMLTVLLLFSQTRLFLRTSTKDRRMPESHFSVQRLNSFQ